MSIFRTLPVSEKSEMGPTAIFLLNYKNDLPTNFLPPLIYTTPMPITSSLAEKDSHSTMNRSFSTPPALPVYQTKSTTQSSRTSLSSSISLNLRHQASSSWTVFGRSKTVCAARESYGGRSVRKIWNWGWGWMFSGSRSSKVEKAELGRPSRTSWGDLVHKARLRFRKLLVLNDNAGQPQTCRYNSFDYSKNFDDGSSKFYP